MKRQQAVMMKEQVGTTSLSSSETLPKTLSWQPKYFRGSYLSFSLIPFKEVFVFYYRHIIVDSEFYGRGGGGSEGFQKTPI